ncbi:hypothetical protein AB9K41_18725 [Cribrihabitans sp. XS_ASV171]
MELDVKCVDWTFKAWPEKTRSGFEIHAGFKLLCFPLRIEDCKLVKTPKGNWTVWTPDERLKINRQALHDLAAFVAEEYDKARAAIAA